MPQKGGTMMRGGVFGINLTSATDAARAITSKAKETASTAYQSAQTKTKTIAVSLDTVVKSLNKLKDAFIADTTVDDITKRNISRCVDQLVAKINQASDTTPENVTSEDIAESVGKAEDTTQAPSGEQFVDMVKRVLALKIVSLKTKYETAINARIQSFKTKYNLGDDDMKCIHVLKDAVLADLINKKNSLITAVMNNQRVKTVIENATKAAAVASAGTQYLKDKVGTVLQQNPKAAAAVSAAKEKGTQFFGTATDKFKTGLGNYLAKPSAATAASAVKENSAAVAAAAKEKAAGLLGSRLGWRK